MYHNAFPRYYQLVPVEAVSHQKSPLKKKFPGFCPSERNPLPFRKYPVGVVQHTPAAGPLRAPRCRATRTAPSGRGLHADGHGVYPVYPAGSGRWAAESVYPAASGRRLGLHADGHGVYPVYPAGSGRRWAAESAYPAGSGRRWAAESEHVGFESVVP